MNIYAHRGFSGRYPENTMLAFRKAAETGCSGIELDVQLSRDGQVVVIHDEELDRTTDGTGPVERYTLAELQRFNAAKIHSEAASFEHIPSFDEYCGWAAATRLVTNIELKTGVVYYRDIERKTLDIVKAHGLAKKVFFSSFNPISVMRMKSLAPDIPCGILVEHPIRHAGLMCRVSGLDYYHPDIGGLTQEAVDECHAHGIAVNVWTVNVKEELEKLRNLKADGAFSNFPDMN